MRWGVGGPDNFEEDLRLREGKARSFGPLVFFISRPQAEGIICEGRRELLAPGRFDFSGRNWISGH